LPLPEHEIVDCSAICEVFFLHLAQESAWGLFLQPQRPAEPRPLFGFWASAPAKVRRLGGFEAGESHVPLIHLQAHL